MRRAVRMTRHAISPRFAIRIFLNMVNPPPRSGGGRRPRASAGGRGCSRRCRIAPSPTLPRYAGEGGLERYVRVLLPWVLQLLVAQHGEAAADSAPRAVRHDDVVDEAAARGDERVGEALAVLLG